MVAVTEPIKSILKIAVSVLRKTDSASSYKTQHALLQSPSSRGVKKISQTFCRIEITKIKIIFLLLEFVRKKNTTRNISEKCQPAGPLSIFIFQTFQFPATFAANLPHPPKAPQMKQQPCFFYRETGGVTF
jgi:hypothetical protein